MTKANGAQIQNTRDGWQVIVWRDSLAVETVQFGIGKQAGKAAYDFAKSYNAN